jgi:hypothetical protein
VNSIPDRCTGSFARADQRRDVRGYAREGVAAAFPGLVLVVAGNEVNAKVADGKLGDVLGHAEPAQQESETLSLHLADKKVYPCRVAAGPVETIPSRPDW